MTPRRLTSLVFAVVLTLTGCRDALVDAPPAAGDSPVSPVEDVVPEMFVKGPATMLVGESASFKAEIVTDVASYDWSIAEFSTGRLTGSVRSDGLYDRLLDVNARQTGIVIVQVTALDSEGRLLAKTSKTVDIVAD